MNMEILKCTNVKGIWGQYPKIDKVSTALYPNKKEEEAIKQKR